MKYKKYSSLIKKSSLALLPLLGIFSAQAQEGKFPTGTVTIVVPYSAGGGTDTVARNLARVWSEEWKKTVVVINKTGADGVIGSQAVLQAPADGHTILLQVNQALFYPVTLPNAKVDIIKDFTLVSKIQQNAMVFGVPSASTAKSFKEFITDCKKTDAACSFGAATRHGEIMARQIIELSGIKNAQVIPYKGTAPMMVDALGGHVSMGMPSLSVAMPHYKNSKFRILASGAQGRLDSIPEVPTLNQEGLNMVAMTWYGLMIKKGTPDEAFKTIVKAVELASQDPKVIAAIQQEGAMPVFSSSASFEKEAKEEFAAVEPLLKKYLLPENEKKEAKK